MSKVVPRALVLLLWLLLAACARHVVLDPEHAQALDNKTWTVLSSPAAPAGSVMLLDASAPDAAR